MTGRTTAVSDPTATSAAPSTSVQVSALDTPSRPYPAAATAHPAPSSAPPVSAPATYQIAVTQNRFPRAASDTGLSEESIDSPQGDHMPRTAATTATARARRTVITGSSCSCAR